MKWYFPHPFLENLSLHTGSLTQVVGQNQELKYYLWQVMLWYFGGKRYKEEDLTLFQQVEPVIRTDLGPIKRTHYRFLPISDVSDVIEQMAYSKGTIAFDYMKKKSQRLDIMAPLDEINELLDKISLQINKVLHLDIGGMTYHVDSHYFTLNQLLLKNFSPYFMKTGQNIAFEFVDNESKILFLLEMLEELLSDDTSPVLLVFKNMDDYLTYYSFSKVCFRMESMLKSFPQLRIIIFPSDEGYLHTSREFLPFINIFGEHRIHLHEFEFMYQRFREHYPSNQVPSEEEFLQCLQKNASYLLSEHLGQISLSVKDLVAITLLNELYHYEKKLAYPIRLPDQMEINFLMDRVDDN